MPGIFEVAKVCWHKTDDRTVWNIADWFLFPPSHHTHRILVPAAGTPELSRVPSSQPGIGEKTVLHALPTARNIAIPISTCVVLSTSFFPATIFKHKGVCKVNSKLDFHLWVGGLSIACMCSWRVTGNLMLRISQWPPPHPPHSWAHHVSHYNGSMCGVAGQYDKPINQSSPTLIHGLITYHVTTAPGVESQDSMMSQ